MALPVNIDNLINRRSIESERIEFKKGWNPEEVMHTICAFANDINNWGAGYIILGIEEKNGVPLLPPCGIRRSQIDKIQKEITNLCYKINPSYTPIIDTSIYKNKHIIVIWVPSGDNRPYKAPLSLGKKKKSILTEWVRKGTITTRATDQDRQKLLEMASKIPFDDRVNHSAKIEDFSLVEIESYLKEVKSDLNSQLPKLSNIEIARKMNIARGADENIFPTNVGLLMFNENPAYFFRGAEIQIVTYEDEVGDNFTEQVFKGPIYRQLRNALQYIRENVIKTKTRKVSGQPESLRFDNYPYEAVEEALANAIYHKSYEHQNCVEVSIRLDRIEILSFPGPLPPLDNKMLKKDRIIARDYRNRRIGDFLKELKLTEGRGTGIPKIRTSMNKNGSPQPSFETDKNNTYFLATLPIHLGFTILKLDEHKISVLNYCKEPRSRREVLNNLGLSNHYENFKKHALPLIRVGYLKYTLPNIPNSVKQRYLTSKKGLDRLNSK